MKDLTTATREALDKMKSRMNWHRDHEKDADVICINFEPSSEEWNAVRWNDDAKTALLVARTEALESFVDHLNNHNISTYIHCGPSGVRFAAVVCSDDAKKKLASLSN